MIEFARAAAVAASVVVVTYDAAVGVLLSWAYLSFGHPSDLMVAAAVAASVEEPESLACPSSRPALGQTEMAAAAAPGKRVAVAGIVELSFSGCP